jgi:hypothetical protein
MTFTSPLHDAGSVVVTVGPENLPPSAAEPIRAGTAEHREEGACFTCGGNRWVEVYRGARFDGVKCATCGRTKNRGKRL